MPHPHRTSIVCGMDAAVDLYWLPLGAGGRFVRLNGWVYERVAASLGRRQPCELYHAALEVTVSGERTVIEMAPVWNGGPGDHGGVVTGAVGAAPLGRWRLFRYEVRRWRDGIIPDIAEAVASPQRLSTDAAAARRVLERCADVPAHVWHHERWNSNSLVAWLLVQSGIGVGGVRLPPNGRAPGWDAGLYVSKSSDILRRASQIPASPSARR